jgi:hypothetical protein
MKGDILPSAKSEALELIQRLPDGVSTAEILDELYFKQQVERGLDDVEQGRFIDHDEMKQRLKKWQKSIGRSVPNKTSRKSGSSSRRTP